MNLVQLQGNFSLLHGEAEESELSCQRKRNKRREKKNKSDIYRGKVEVSLLISLPLGCFFMG